MAKRLALALRSMMAYAKTARQMDVDFCLECARIDLNRILYCALILVPMNLASIIIFSLRHFESEAEAAWQTGLILSHAGLLVLMPVFAVIAWKFRKQSSLARSKVLVLAVTAALMAAGILITSVDQLVVTSITPFGLACLVVGALFLIRPAYSAPLFLVSFAVFFFAVDRGAAAAVVLSNRVNGMASAAIGFGLSTAMWRHFMVERAQRHQIEAQTRELERVNRELQNMAFTDSLTGLPNRRYFDQALARELAAIERGGQVASVIEFDLDFFKKINDTCGHAAGDEVLKQVAELVNGTIRRADLFARYGGEEFILLLPETQTEGAQIAAEKLRKQIEAHPFHADGREIRLTASFGVAELNQSPAAGYYRMVDQALYQAKKKGRNRVEVLRQEAPREPDSQAAAL